MIKGLNLRYLHKNTPTDVLVFDLSGQDKPAYTSADIIISTDRAIRNSKVFGTTPLYELYLYVVHGLLHTLGYDDKTKKQRQIMDRKADKILSTLNLKL
jgi:probable rRNA maturation factor